MIYLSMTQSSKVVATAKQNRIDLLSSYFTWKIVNRDSFDEWIFSADDWSNSDYYSAFTMSVGQPQVATGSQITIDAIPGQYDYQIYQSSTQYNLNLDSVLGQVESGILIINGTNSNTDSGLISFTQSNDDTIKVFNEL